MLRAAEPPLRQGFCLRQKRLYGALAPRPRRAVGRFSYHVPSIQNIDFNCPIQNERSFFRMSFHFGFRPPEAASTPLVFECSGRRSRPSAKVFASGKNACTAHSRRGPEGPPGTSRLAVLNLKYELQPPHPHVLENSANFFLFPIRLFNRTPQKGPLQVAKKREALLTDYFHPRAARFYRLAYSYLKNREEALDAVQTAVCRAWERQDSLRGPVGPAHLVLPHPGQRMHRPASTARTGDLCSPGGPGGGGL